MSKKYEKRKVHDESINAQRQPRTKGIHYCIRRMKKYL